MAFCHQWYPAFGCRASAGAGVSSARNPGVPGAWYRGHAALHPGLASPGKDRDHRRLVDAERDAGRTALPAALTRRWLKPGAAVDRRCVFSMRGRRA